MRSRGVELGINAIIIATLAIIVLFILLAVLNSSIKKTMQDYLGITQSAEEDFKGRTCVTILSGRKCLSGFDCSLASTVQEEQKKWHVVPAPDLKEGKTWSDCPSTKVCCERIA